MLKAENKNILLHVSANSLSYFGDLFYLMAINIWVSRNTDDPRLLGIVTTVGSFALFAGNPFGGIIADHFSRRKLLIIADLMCAFAAFLTYLFYKDNEVLLLPLLISEIVLGLAFSVYSPTSRAIAPLLTQENNLHRLNSYLSVTTETIRIIVPAVSGILLTFSFITEKELLLIITISFLLSALADSFLTVRENVDKSEPLKFDFIKSYGEVWKELGSTRVTLIPICLVNFFTGGLTVLYPFLGKTISKTHYTNMLLAQAVGAVVGGLIASQLDHHLTWKKTKWLLLCSAIFICVLHPAIPTWAHFFSLFVFGACLAIFNVNFFTTIQTITPEHIIGRTFGLIFTAAAGLIPLGNFIFGMIGGRVSNFGIPLAGVGLFLAMAFIILFEKKLFYILETE